MRRVIVISDSHLGGRPDERSPDGRLLRAGSQICNSYAELVRFIDWLREPDAASRPEDLELVINGDLVDFLLEDDFDDPAMNSAVWAADETLAIEKLDRIVERTRMGASRGVFDAFKDFLAGGHRLTLLTGNHDVELSLPAVRRRLIWHLGADGKRFQFFYDGEAYILGRVLIEHGNRYDAWNQIDYSGLRQERSVRSRRLPVLESERTRRYFVAPPGTHLVTYFLNRIKDRYRFVDLLKPETNAVLPLLIFLEPDRRPELEEIVQAGGVFWKLRQQGLATPTTPKRTGDLARTEDKQKATLDHVLEETLDSGEAALFVEEDRATVEQFSSAGDLSLGSRWNDGIEWLRAKAEPLLETYRSASAVWGLRREGPDEHRYRQLHAALKRLNLNDSSFTLSSESKEYLNAAAETAQAGDFDVVIYGHTHLPRQVPLKISAREPGEPDRDCWYLNTGTWCDVLRLPDSITRDYSEARAELEKFIQALGANDFNPYRHSYLGYAELIVDVEGTGMVSDSNLYFFGSKNPRCKPFTSSP